jgi:hypothetical protein
MQDFEAGEMYVELSGSMRKWAEDDLAEATNALEAAQVGGFACQVFCDIAFADNYGRPKLCIQKSGCTMPS